MKNKGITLVALVITIIILLILAGITISQLAGSGLFNNTQTAKQEYENAQAKEDDILKQYENAINNGKIVSDRDTVTIPKEEYEQLKNVNNYKLSQEKAIGTWVNGKTVYQKTLANSTTLKVGKWTDTSIDSSSIGTLIDICAYQDNGSVLRCLNASIDHGTVYVYFSASQDLQIAYITIQYTKVELPETND